MSAALEIGQHGDPFRTSEGAQGVFRVLLDAMARPGTIRNCPRSIRAAPIETATGLAAIAQTLLDHEVTFAVDADDDDGNADAAPTFAAHIRSVTGCRDFPVRRTPTTSLPSEARPPACPRYSRQAYRPSRMKAATLVSLVPALDGKAGITLSLSGPGVPPETVATVPGWSLADLVSLAAANSSPPLGIDVILVDAAGQVMCLPRSTRLTAEHLPHTRTGDPGTAQEVADGLYRG